MREKKAAAVLSKGIECERILVSRRKIVRTILFHKFATIMN